MRQGAPDFMERLGLAPDADERQVKRAYARELKRIDQERDLDGFQHLRACYEAALAWAARRAVTADAAAGQGAPGTEPGHAEPEKQAPQSDYRPRYTPATVRFGTEAPPAPAPVMAPAPRADLPPSPLVLAGAVFADFGTAAAALGAAPELAKADDATRIAPWTAALRTAQADPRLMHLDARAVFEERVAALLADGWRPGHHLLLPAAIEVFGWGEDRHGLLRLGYQGRVLDVAIEQLAMFRAQDVKQRTAQRAALPLLRAPEPPGERTMRRHIRAVRALASQFPDLLAIVAPRAVVTAWLERCPPTAREVKQDMAAGQDQGRWWTPKSWSSAAFLIFILLRVAMYFGSHDTPRSPPVNHESYDRLDAPRFGKPPAGAPWEPLYPNADAVLRAQRNHVAPRGGRALTDAQLAAIHARIDYRPGPGSAPGRQQANLLVTLDDKGFVSNIDVLSAAADPAFTAAAQLAVRQSAPFPPQTTRMFSTVLSDVVPQARRVPPAPAAAPPDVPARPGQRGNPVPQARMAAIRARIDYRPGVDVVPGEQRVVLEVRLDAKGGIAGMKRLVVRGDPAWADAVEAAIRGAGPFASDTARAFTLQFWVKLAPRPADKLPAAPQAE